MTILFLVFTINTHALAIEILAGNISSLGVNSNIPINGYYTYSKGDQAIEDTMFWYMIAKITLN